LPLSLFIPTLFLFFPFGGSRIVDRRDPGRFTREVPEKGKRKKKTFQTNKSSTETRGIKWAGRCRCSRCIFEESLKRKSIGETTGETRAHSSRSVTAGLCATPNSWKNQKQQQRLHFRDWERGNWCPNAVAFSFPFFPTR
jgi:hypothetical protein